MKIIRDFEKLSQLKKEKIYVSMGTFDGVHIGHQKLITKCVNEAKENNAYSLVVTFDKHPRFIFDPERKIDFITSNSEKLALIKKLRVDICFVMPFDKQIAAMSPDSFIKKILIDLIGMSKLFIGFNFTYGKLGAGNTTTLETHAKKYGFDLYILELLRKNNYLVSSSNVRLLLSSGVVEKSSFFLGRVFTLSGKIIKGRGLGKTLGFPTANIKLENSEKMLPLSGVYACEIKLGSKCLRGVVNIGGNPTISKENKTKAEVHIFDFNGNIYGRRLKIYFKKRLRDEIKFENLEDLSETVKRDILRTKNFFERGSN